MKFVWHSPLSESLKFIALTIGRKRDSRRHGSSGGRFHTFFRRANNVSVTSLAKSTSCWSQGLKLLCWRRELLTVPSVKAADTSRDTAWWTTWQDSNKQEMKKWVAISVSRKVLGKSTPNLQIRERPGPPDPEIKEGGGGRPPKKKFGSWGLSLVKNYGRGGGGGVWAGPPWIRHWLSLKPSFG